MKYLILSICLLYAISSCKKESTASTPASVNANACGATGATQDTVLDNGSKYYIVAGCSGSNSTMVVELVKTAGPGASSYSASFAQVSKGSNCYRSSAVTSYLAPSQMPAYSFGSFPAWANDTNAVTVCKISIGSNAYYFRDPKMNK